MACELQTVKQLPASGAWANPDQNGSGFYVEVQGMLAAIAYFGYDEAGNPDWYLLSGDLVPSERDGVLWEIEGSPSRFSGGSCLDCEYVAPVSEVLDTTIRFEFLQRAHARMVLADGSFQYLVPLMFGTGGAAFFADQTPYLLPLFEPVDLPFWGVTPTPWLLVVDPVSLDPFESGPWTIDTTIVTIDPASAQRDDSGALRVRYPVTRYQEFVEGSLAGEIVCGALQEGDPTPFCRFELPPDLGSSTGSRTAIIALANMTDERISGVTEDGDRFEAYRLFYD
jgi:hypothetical protein